MAPSLAAGDIDGYCVGEPFNTLAVKQGIGKIVAESANISPMHPEKALVVSAGFQERHPETHVELIRAISEASTICDTPEGREQAVEILSQPHYLGLEPDLLRSSLFTDDREDNGTVHSESFHIFSDPEVNRPSADKANWLVSQMRNAGLIDELDLKSESPLSQIFREDIFKTASLAGNGSKK